MPSPSPNEELKVSHDSLSRGSGEYVSEMMLVGSTHRLEREREDECSPFSSGWGSQYALDEIARSGDLVVFGSHSSVCVDKFVCVCVCAAAEGLFSLLYSRCRVCISRPTAGLVNFRRLLSELLAVGKIRILQYFKMHLKLRYFLISND